MIDEINLKIIALLPMKGNSQRVPNKNMREFSGKPLYHAVVNALKHSKYISKVIINTDSQIIKNDAIKSFGDFVEIIDRPEYLLGDCISMNPIIEHDINKQKEEYFMQTHSTNPLLRSSTIDDAIEMYIKNKDKYDSIFSVTKWQTRLYDKNVQPINHNLQEMLRTQDLEPIFEENSNFYIFSKKSFEDAGKRRIGLYPMMYQMDKLESVDIDWEEDFELAELLYESRH